MSVQLVCSEFAVSVQLVCSEFAVSLQWIYCSRIYPRLISFDILISHIRTKLDMCVNRVDLVWYRVKRSWLGQYVNWCC